MAVSPSGISSDDEGEALGLPRNPRHSRSQIPFMAPVWPPLLGLPFWDDLLAQIADEFDYVG